MIGQDVLNLLDTLLQAANQGQGLTANNRNNNIPQRGM